MRRLMAWMLLLTVALAPAATAATPNRSASRPMMAYFIDYYVIPDKATQMASVAYTTDYTLEDGTHIGSDYVGWGGQSSQAGSSYMNAVIGAVMSGVGGQAGWNFGAWAGSWAANQVAINASYATYAMGLGALAAGPWVGFAVGAFLGAS